ncbi:hypothetical protein [Hymenobacter sp. 102]|uniref:hypothetical protein n=1 Tax=Hymenobacter sp. 102 TaxID=3403152 RepID=UPI003CF80845
MPKFYQAVETPPMKSEEMMRDLLAVPKVLRRLAEQQTEWQPLAEILLSLEGDAKIPTGKKLQQDLGLSPAKYRRWLDAFYSAYLHLLESDADTIVLQQVEHQLILTGRRASQTLSCRLPITPRIGEQLQLDFLRAVTGESMFYVENIIHDFSDGRYLVLVYLKPGYYNAYQHSLKARARFDDTIGLDVFFHAPDYLLDDLLRERYPPPSESSKAEEALDKAEARYGISSLFGRRRRR